MSTRLRAIIIWEIIIEKLIRQNYHQLETRKTRLCTAGDYEDECFPRILQMLPRSIIQGQPNLKRFVYKRIPLLEDTLKKNLVLFQSLSLSNFFQLCPLFQFYMHSLCFPHYRRTPLILWVFIWFLIFSMNCRWLSWKAPSTCSLSSPFIIIMHCCCCCCHPQSEHSLCHIFVPPNQKKILGPGRASFWAPSSHCRVYYFLAVDFYQQKSDLDMPWLALPTVSKNLKPPINEASVRSWQRSDWQWCRALDLSGIHTVCAQTQKHTDANILMCFLTRLVRLGLELNIIVTSLAD